MKAKARQLMPFSLWQSLGFVTRIPSYWRRDRSDALRVRNGVTGLPLYVTPEISVFSPESVTAYLNWCYAGLQTGDCQRESLDFIELGRDRGKLFDIGAQTGFMSALFARSHAAPVRIVSVEPDPLVLPLLRRAVELNGSKGKAWEVVPAAMSNASGRMHLTISKVLYENADPAPVAVVDVECLTLANLIIRAGFEPDIVKIDIESGEHEVLTSSLALIEQVRPALQLEIHWEMLAMRNLSAWDFLDPLAQIGYRGLRRNQASPDCWRRCEISQAVSRIALAPG